MTTPDRACLHTMQGRVPSPATMRLNAAKLLCSKYCRYAPEADIECDPAKRTFRIDLLNLNPVTITATWNSLLH